ncbi:MAG: hypothetical protein QXR57_07280 [Metallosphaera sp.]|uniref:hypothetical protein n=1 Tax=Metallosphaera sp. TaxID=2020860 RepID=UPI003164B4B0
MNSGLRVGEVIAIILIAGALSLGFLGGNPSAQIPQVPSLSVIDHYTGLNWLVQSSYKGVADSAPTPFLQSFGSDVISYSNMSDNQGDTLVIFQAYFPSSQSALNYLNSVSPVAPQLVNNVWVSVYSLGQVEIVYMVSGSHLVQISYVGSSESLPNTSSLENLASYIL